MKSYKRLTIAEFVALLVSLFTSTDWESREVMFFSHPFGDGVGTGVRFLNFHDNFVMMVGGYGFTVDILNLLDNWTIEQLSHELEKHLRLNWVGLGERYIYMEVEDKQTQ